MLHLLHLKRGREEERRRRRRRRRAESGERRRRRAEEDEVGRSQEQCITSISPGFMLTGTRAPSSAAVGAMSITCGPATVHTLPVLKEGGGAGVRRSDEEKREARR